MNKTEVLEAKPLEEVSFEAKGPIFFKNSKERSFEERKEEKQEPESKKRPQVFRRLSINPNRGVLNFTPKKAPSFLNESGISRPCSLLDVVNSKDDF
jgi:hypothetical protein